MLGLRFSGWCQIRLATDPDPYDEPAGASGRTIALAEEAPLDRVIRFQSPVNPRIGAPPVGVTVDGVFTAGGPLDGHALADARIDLLEGPRFEGRNGLVADDGYEPIHPFVLRIAADEVAMQRDDPASAPWDERAPDPLALAHRFGLGLESTPEVEADVGRAVDIDDPEAWCAARRTRLERARDGLPPCAARSGLDLRLEMLEPIALARVRYHFM